MAVTIGDFSALFPSMTTPEADLDAAMAAVGKDDLTLTDVLKIQVTLGKVSLLVEAIGAPMKGFVDTAKGCLNKIS